MSETSQAETFTERLDVTTQPDGAFIGTLEIDVRPSDRQEEQLRTLKDECDRLRDRVAELERLLANTQALNVGGPQRDALKQTVCRQPHFRDLRRSYPRK